MTDVIHEIINNSTNIDAATLKQVLEKMKEPIIEKKTNSTLTPVMVSIFCVGIILFILFTQCEISSIKLKPKDASLILIFLALVAYINQYHILFLVLLGTFIFIYFSPNDFINNIFSKFIKTKPKSIIKKTKKVRIEPEEILSPEITLETEGMSETEITLDTDIDIDIDDELDEPQNSKEDIYMNAKKEI